ncbi:hypothetical protein ABPG75_010901 [Micractinium tetrahymenae]
MLYRMLFALLLAAVGVSAASAHDAADQALLRGRSLRAASCVDHNCAECKFGGTYCVRCKDGFDAATSVDIGLLPCRPVSNVPKQCKSGYGLIGGECKKCAAGCSRCAGSASACSACRHGWDLSGSTCKALAPNPACKDRHCAKCSTQGGIQFCNECQAGYHVAHSVHSVAMPCRPRA